MKRFTETNKWIDPWFQGLPVNSKILFLYLTDNCDNAGFIEDNPRMASFQIGISEVEYEGALKGLGRGIKGASGWLWIRRFLRHQKNEPLNKNNPAHRQIARLIAHQLGRFNGMLEFQEFISPYKEMLNPRALVAPAKGLPRPLGTGTGTLKRGSTEGERTYQKPKLPAPIYDKLPPKRDPSDEELAQARRIAHEETAKLKAKLRP